MEAPKKTRKQKIIRRINLLPKPMKGFCPLFSLVDSKVVPSSYQRTIVLVVRI